ncbi:MAG: hypothetical protein A2W93_01675 [Bacteroidetes bacterium GWF2_43_63]|nr:MAG: hypothetical protein A2W94_10400 [Bacteroidetes bacterium GWE2_42_42]OFY55777.1 MAG: hypothetical protein A2W93_01675 [Bacteroidetes bacterium GWF2_43_63]HBG71307.1 hypothetical protein [Bacteroidales bacterium]HCB60472.1 hypothetical protein [Bacteroidales bacterium]HCY22571.1 hypothetical protein [Bacteroidales bacterium]
MKASNINTAVFLVFVSLGLFFSSCESYRTVDVVVKDFATKECIDSAFVQTKAGKNNDFEKSGTQGYTDSTGHFTGDFMIGCAFGCYDIIVECSKPGYKKYVSEMNVMPDTIWLSKE